MSRSNAVSVPLAAGALMLVLGALALLDGSAGAAARAKADESGNACRPSTETIEEALTPREPVPLATALDPTVLAQYGVLRRAATEADLLPPLNLLGTTLEGKLASYYPSYIRRLIALPDGGRYMLVTGFVRVAAVPPAPCLPASVRPQRARLVTVEQRLALEPVYCVGIVGEPKESNNDISCTRYSTVPTGAGLAEGVAGGGEFSSRPKIELAPDGVASVRLTFSSGPPTLVPVSENAYMFTPSPEPFARLMRGIRQLEKRARREHRKLGSKRAAGEVHRLLARYERERTPDVQWLAADGQTIRSFTPRPGSRSAESLLNAVLGAPVDSSGRLTAGPAR